MAKLYNKARREKHGKAVPLEGLDGCFVRAVPLAKIKQFAALEEETRDPVKLLVWLGNNLLCDADGQVFEDLATEEAAGEIDIGFAREINDLVAEHLGANEGNPGAD